MGRALLDESFDAESFDLRLTWFCPPGRWSVDAARGVLSVEPVGGSDFWSKPHQGVRADDGHFLHLPVVGDFVATTKVRFRFANQYDQAGLMVRVSESCWLKTSVEYEPEPPSLLGAVVTNGGFSDWSTQAFSVGRDAVWLRVRAEQGDLIVEASQDGTDWAHLRTAHLHESRPDGSVDCGLYACSPKGAGFVAEFEFLKIDAPDA